MGIPANAAKPKPAIPPPTTTTSYWDLRGCVERARHKFLTRVYAPREAPKIMVKTRNLN